MTGRAGVAAKPAAGAAKASAVAAKAPAAAKASAAAAKASAATAKARGGAVSPSDDRSAAQDSRRTQMLRAALDVLVERGFPDTRIADVAERSEVSPALVIYYFKTKDRL